MPEQTLWTEQPIWIESDEQLREQVSQWRDCIALDTEFIRTDTFYPVPGLYQIAWSGRVYLLDPLRIDDWSCFVAVLEDPGICKIMHACQEDLELIYHHLGVQPNNVFDTQLANAFVSDQFSLSYAALVAKLLDIELPKHATRSNWLKRPLTEEQLTYAVEDVIHLHSLHAKLLDKLGERRHWFEGEMQLRAVYQPSQSLEYYKNVKKAWQLNGRQLSALRSLCAWREDTAKDLNIPRNRVVWDDHLYQFARTSQLNVEHVRRALPRAVANRFADRLIAVHADGQAQAPPPSLPRPLSPSHSAVVKRLRETARGQAERLGLAPELLSRKREVEECVRHVAAEGRMSDRYLGWRAEALGDLFEGIFIQEMDQFQTGHSA